MATYTTNYNLKKPADSDFINVADFNGNADIIDEELKKRPTVGKDGKLSDDLLPDLSETYEEKGAVETAVSAHNTSANAHNDIRTEVGKKAPAPIIATTPPTTSTVGVVGQAYIDTASLRIWRCTKANNGSYTWDQLLNVLKGSGAPTTSTVGVVGQVYADTKTTDLYICQKASTTDGYNWVGIITSGNISSQNTSFANIASTAYYSIGSVPRGVPALRNEYFVAKDEYDENADAPTNEGVICWLYG